MSRDESEIGYKNRTAYILPMNISEMFVHEWTPVSQNASKELHYYVVMASGREYRIGERQFYQLKMMLNLPGFGPNPNLSRLVELTLVDWQP